MDPREARKLPPEEQDKIMREAEDDDEISGLQLHAAHLGVDLQEALRDRDELLETLQNLLNTEALYRVVHKMGSLDGSPTWRKALEVYKRVRRRKEGKE